MNLEGGVGGAKAEKTREDTVNTLSDLPRLIIFEQYANDNAQRSLRAD